MAVSKANQRAVNKYVKTNYDRVNVTMPKGRKDVIQAHAEARSESVNGFINRAIVETMERDNGGAAAPGAAQEGAGTAPAGRVVSPLPPDTLEAAQRAADAAGEALPDFMRRAVENQTKRDFASLRMGINPATGGKLEKEA